MPIDTNLANWNKENEPSEKRTPTNLRRSTNVQQGNAPLRRSGQLSTPPTKCSPLSPQGTPKPACQAVSCMFEKNTLKRGVQQQEEHESWFKIQQVFSSKQNTFHVDENKEKSADEEELMDELLQLCSWWSDTEQASESVQRCCQEEEQQEVDAPLFQELANYLSELREEPVNGRKEREVLLPLFVSDSDFDLNASF